MQPPSVTIQVGEISVGEGKKKIFIFICSFRFMAQPHKHDTAMVQEQERAARAGNSLHHQRKTCSPTAEELDFMFLTHQSP